MEYQTVSSGQLDGLFKRSLRKLDVNIKRDDECTAVKGHGGKGGILLASASLSLATRGIYRFLKSFSNFQSHCWRFHAIVSVFVQLHLRLIYIRSGRVVAAFG